MKTILFVESGSGYGGSSVCLGNLLRWLDRSAYRPLVAYYADGVGIERIRQLDVETVRLVPGRRLWQLLRLIAKRRVHLVHNNNELYSQISTMMAVALTRVPCICSLRATRSLTRRERLWVPLVRRFVAVSEATRQAYLQGGIAAERIVTIWDGIDLERFPEDRPDARRALPPGIRLHPDRLTVGVVSRLIPEKGIRELLQAARSIVDSFPKVQFLIIGGDPTPGGPHLKTWKALAARLRLTRDVIFTGWRVDIEAITPWFDIAAQASKYWEGLGTSILEAMACGKPVVATRIGGVPEVVADGTTGLLVQPGDSAALADALLTLLKDPSLRARMGHAGRLRAEQHYDQRTLIAQMQELYARVLNGGTG